ncbi:hypothetical protein [Chryseobacterium sp.]|uniref:hypothetical protein n=1 Tax=Chryseobacterium sp. TaxID=1871047 RepID=UPI0011C8215C|nr:hypothetical protein [Chryseobacterium sp.]TXF76365.1 hypothetical protein FUA25_10805 [Chryseobacterium sp.]
MFKISKTKLFAGILTLAILNFAAFYTVRKGIALSVSANAQDPTAAPAQQSAFFDFFPAAIFTIDFAVILLLLFFLVKMLIRTLKTSKNTQ